MGIDLGSIFIVVRLTRNGNSCTKVRFIPTNMRTTLYTDSGSAQNRFCGTSLPRIGGIDNNNVYVSEENQLILWLKTNGDTNIGVFHLHFLF